MYASNMSTFNFEICSSKLILLSARDRLMNFLAY